MSVYLEMILLEVVVVFIIDLSGWTDTWKGWLGRWLGVQVGRVRPFDCSTCSTWWACLILLLCTHSLSWLTIAFAAVLAAFSPQVAQVITFVRYALETAISIANALCDAWWDLLHKNKI